MPLGFQSFLLNLLPRVQLALSYLFLTVTLVLDALLLLKLLIGQQWPMAQPTVMAIPLPPQLSSLPYHSELRGSLVIGVPDLLGYLRGIPTLLWWSPQVMEGHPGISQLLLIRFTHPLVPWPLLAGSPIVLLGGGVSEPTPQNKRGCETKERG